MPRTDAVADRRQVNGGIALAVPPPEALDSEARFLPDGSIDWLWYYEQQDILEAWWDAGLCVSCGIRPKNGAMAICETSDCENLGVNEYRLPRRCGFCGSKKHLSSTGAGGFSGPTTPIGVNYCSKCNRREMPPREQLSSQGRLF